MTTNSSGCAICASNPNIAASIQKRGFPIPSFRMCMATLLLVLVGVVLMDTGMNAQTKRFEYATGSIYAYDHGHAAVPVLLCADNTGPGWDDYGNGVRDSGFISVGTTDTAGSIDVVVSLVDSSGAQIWMYRYDITGTNFADTGYSIREVSNGGYIITGSTYNANSNKQKMFLLRLACDGSVMWTRTFQFDSSTVGYDVIEAVQAATPGQPGDFIVCGKTTTTAQNGGVNGFVMRTDGNGVLRWITQPVVGTTMSPSAEWFNALVECQFNQGGTVDIVAAGAATNGVQGLGLQAYVTRMDASNGSIATYGVAARATRSSTVCESFVRYSRNRAIWSSVATPSR